LRISAARDRLLVATPYPNRTLRLLSWPDGSVLAEVTEIKKTWKGLALRPDGKQFAWAADETVHIADDSGTVLHSITAADDVEHLAWSPDQESLIGALDKGKVCVWDAQTGEERACFAHHRGVASIDFLQGGLLLTPEKRSEEPKLYIRGLDDVQGIVLLPRPEEEYGTDQLAVDVSSGGVVASVDKRKLHLFTPDGDYRGPFNLGLDETEKFHDYHGYGVAFSPDGTRVAVATGSNANVGSGHALFSVQVFDTDGQRLAQNTDFLGEVHAISVAGTTVGVATEWGVVLDEDGERRVLIDKNMSALGLSPDGTLASVANNSGYSNPAAAALSVADGERLAEPEVNKDSGRAAAFCSDNAHFATATDKAQLWKLGRKSAVKSYDLRRPSATVFSADGTLFACSGGGTAIVADVTEKGATLRTFNTEQGDARRAPGVFHLAFSPDGQRLAAAAHGGTRIWNCETGERETILGEGTHLAVAWSADGTAIAHGGLRGEVCIRDAESGEARFSVDMGAKVTSMAFDADGRLVVSSEGGPVRIYGPVG